MSPLRKAAEEAAEKLLPWPAGETAVAAIEAVASAHAERVVRGMLEVVEEKANREWLVCLRGHQYQFLEWVETEEEAQELIDRTVAAALARAEEEQP